MIIISNFWCSNRNYLVVLAMTILIAGCKLGVFLSKQKATDNSYIFYQLNYNNRSANHKPLLFYVSRDTISKFVNHTLYTFYLSNDEVTKFINYGGQRTNYILSFDSSKIDMQSTFPISQLDFQIFKKIVYYSDSLKLKNFNFLKKATNFKVVPGSKKTY